MKTERKGAHPEKLERLIRQKNRDELDGSNGTTKGGSLCYQSDLGPEEKKFVRHINHLLKWTGGEGVILEKGTG